MDWSYKIYMNGMGEYLKGWRNGDYFSYNIIATRKDAMEAIMKYPECKYCTIHEVTYPKIMRTGRSNGTKKVIGYVKPSRKGFIFIYEGMKFKLKSDGTLGEQIDTTNEAGLKI